MPGELESALGTVAARIAEYVKSAAEMRVITQVVRESVGPNSPEEQPRLVASTIMKLDGDSEVVIPLHQADNGHFEIDTAMLEVHRANVTTAIEYRARVLDALLKALPVPARNSS